MKSFILLFIFFLIFIAIIYYVYTIKREKFVYLKNHNNKQLKEEDMIKLLTLLARYIRPDIEKMITISVGEKSETLSKKHIKICLYDKEKKMYLLPTLMYVLIHEMTHVITETVSGYENIPHDSLFYSNLNTMLNQAKEKGIYVSMENVPESYCKK